MARRLQHLLLQRIAGQFAGSPTHTSGLCSTCVHVCTSTHRKIVTLNYWTFSLDSLLDLKKSHRIFPTLNIFTPMLLCLQNLYKFIKSICSYYGKHYCTWHKPLTGSVSKACCVATSSHLWCHWEFFCIEHSGPSQTKSHHHIAPRNTQ